MNKKKDWIVDLDNIEKSKLRKIKRKTVEDYPKYKKDGETIED